MAKVVQSQDFPEIQRRHRKYPWDEWEDGQIWEITGGGKDFDVTPRYMQTQLHVRARHIGRTVTTRVVGDKITFTFQKKGESEADFLARTAS